MEKKVFNNFFFAKTACAWGTIFEKIAQEYMERKLSVLIFGSDICLNTGKGHPLLKKKLVAQTVTLLKKNELCLIEFKCPSQRVKCQQDM